MGVDVRRAAALGRIGSGPKSGRNNVTLAEGASTRSPGLAVLYSILPIIAAFALFSFSPCHPYRGHSKFAIFDKTSPIGAMPIKSFPVR
jgi:hypothetical protein